MVQSTRALLILIAITGLVAFLATRLRTAHVAQLNQAEELEELRVEATDGDASAQYRLGLKHEIGHG